MTENLAPDVTTETERAPAKRLSAEQLKQFAQLGSWHDGWLHNLLADVPTFSSVMLAVQTQGTLQPAALWPRDQAVLNRLGDLVDTCCQQGQPLMLPPGEGISDYGIVYPVILDNQIQAVFAGYLPLSQTSLEQIMAEVEKHCVWIENWLSQEQVQQHKTDIRQQRTVIDGYVAVGKGNALQESALQWVDSLAQNFACDRVSLGTIKHKVVALDVISGSSDHALNSVTTKQIIKTMQEACDQRCSISWPAADSENHIGIQAEKLSIAHHNACVLSVPVYHDDEPYLVLTFERPAKALFSAEEIERIEANLALVGVAFQHRRQAELTFWGATKKHCTRQFERLLAPGYLKRKLFFIGLFALSVFMLVARGDYQINADAMLEPRLIRIVSAPFNGYLKSASVRAGDLVKEGSVLASMEDSELRLEKIKSISRLEQNNKQYTDALAARDRSQAQIYSAQMAQAQAQLNAADSKLERATLRAPFDALVVSGDLSQRIGGSVAQGEELFRLSPMQDYRLTLYVSEFKINQIQQGQTGRVVLSSMPDEHYDFEVETLTPVTEVRDGSTLFRVEARLLQNDAQFRPGLVGVAKVSAGERHLIDMWTQNLRAWLTLKLWTFWG